jgi:hypothetical protein
MSGGSLSRSLAGTQMHPPRRSTVPLINVKLIEDVFTSE